MKKYFVDTNVFLRLIVNDNTEQHKIAEQIFIDASHNKLKLFTSLVVFFEIFWVLTSFYEKSKKDVVIILKHVLRMSFIELEAKETIEKAVAYFEKHNLELEDCYNIFYTLDKGVPNILTFDKKLEKNFKKLKN